MQHSFHVVFSSNSADRDLKSWEQFFQDINEWCTENYCVRKAAYLTNWGNVGMDIVSSSRESEIAFRLKFSCI